MPWWAGKQNIREYLRKFNEDEKVRCSRTAIRLVLTFPQVLEYILFQPGLFLDYQNSSYKTAKHVEPLDSVFDYQNCRAILVEGHGNAIMTLTMAADPAGIVARAADHEGKWPEIGGIRGNKVTFSQVVEIGEKIRGVFHSLLNCQGVSSLVYLINLQAVLLPLTR